MENAPLLQQGLEFYYLAYWDLTSCRGFDGVIPWTAIDHYASRLRCDYEQYSLLCSHVRELEAEHKAHHEKTKPKK